ncbi:hypothetical protein ACFY1L_55950 [Streptomyces sp. NPDC001663]|uniref:hypothetical protein n=1 Tax=Streptomyces sp. NPDC001663 TaxID=3364597 RepID=UPI00367ECF70
MPLITVKRMRSPEEITTEGRKAVFLEDQGEDFWAFDLDNPMDVYEGKLYGDWEKANEDLSEFLIHNALNEAAYGARATRSWDAVPESLLAEILSPMEEVAFGGWRWPSPGGRVFVSDALVANIGPAVEDSAPWGDRPGYAEVQIGSSRPGLLSYLDEIEGIDWLKSGAVD